MLKIAFQYDDELCDYARPVRIEEDRGRVTYKLYRGLFLPEGVASLNSGADMLIGAGHWFQLWKGEIVSMCSPETREDAHAGVHRGPMADQATGPIHR